MLHDYLTGQQQAEFTVVIKITSNTANFNLSTTLQNTYGWNGTSNINSLTVIEPGVIVYSNTSATPAFWVTSDLEQTGVHVLINEGYITGSRGAGGSPTGNGTAGGPALRCDATYVVHNKNGSIRGGGGGGGGGGSGSGGRSDAETGCEQTNACTGGSGGTGFGGLNLAATGGGSATPADALDCAKCGSGGSGGAPGSAGSGGANATNTCICEQINTSAGSGGAAGNAVIGNSNIVWVSTGIRTGPIS